MARDKSVKELEAELSQLKEQIKVAKQQELIREIITSPEFKTIGKKFAKIGTPPAVIAKLFAAAAKSSSAARKSRTKVPPKYRHPENSKLLWAGRGNKPLWVRECLEKGLTMDDLLIEK